MAIELRVAIAGAGLMGHWHARYARDCGARICGVVDPAPDAAQRLAARYSAVVSEAKLEAVLKQQRLDALHICSPAGAHAALAREALLAGLHVLVEKPMAGAAAECEELFRLAASRGLVLTPVHQFVFQDGVIAASAALQRIGPLLHMDAVICSAGGQHHTKSDPAKSDLDELAADVMIHPLSVMERLVPGILARTEWNVLRPEAGEWRVLGGASTGMSISALVSFQGRPTECSIHLIGANGTVHVDLFHGFAFTAGGGVSRLRKILQPFGSSVRHAGSAALNLTRRAIAREPAYPGLRRLIREFYRAVRSETAAPLSEPEIFSVAQARDTLISMAGKL